MNNLTYSTRASSATPDLLPSTFSGHRGLYWARMGQVKVPLGMGVHEEEAGPSRGAQTERLCSVGSPSPCPVLLALPGVPVLLWDRQHGTQLPGGALPCHVVLGYPVLGHPQWGGCLCDSGHG